jgi:murein DD-endopeptidase MepM/ murein hydrolase activator NlpD
LLNASVGMQRVLTRLRPTQNDRTDAAVRFHRRSVAVARDIRVRASSLPSTSQLAPTRMARAAAMPVHRSLRGRVGPEAALPAAVAVIVGLASLVSWLPGVPARGAVGGPTGDGPEPRIALGGAVLDARDDGRSAPEAATPAPSPASAGQPLEGPGVDYGRIDPDVAISEREAAAAREATLTGPFLSDGTLLKPIAVDTTVADGSGLLRTYKVRQGDTLTSIAARHGVSMMTVWWANNLKSKRLTVGRELVIPPVDGLVVKVKDGDTLEGISKTYGVAADRIYETNKLQDRVLVSGQVLVVAGAKGDPIPTPTPKPTAKPPAGGGGGGGSGGGGGGSVSGPTKYTGGAFAWPVVGGGNYVSQGYHTGHYGIDIAADYGSRVRAAAGGTVTFAGWKSNGGGYQVWISHGSGLYTTYNHMSAVTVGRGQKVGKGQQVGRIGQSGNATGPHLHFEVWRGPIWNGGSRVNPMRYL